MIVPLPLLVFFERGLARVVVRCRDDSKLEPAGGQGKNKKKERRSPSKDCKSGSKERSEKLGNATIFRAYPLGTSKKNGDHHEKSGSKNKNRIRILVSGTIKTDPWKGHFKNGCTERSFLKRMYTNQTSILTDVYKGLLGNGSAQDMGQIPDPCNLYHGSM